MLLDPQKRFISSGKFIPTIKNIRRFRCFGNNLLMIYLLSFGYSRGLLCDLIDALLVLFSILNCYVINFIYNMFALDCVKNVCWRKGVMP